MGQSFKNRDEKQEFIRAMTSPVTGSDWIIALSFDGPILRQFMAVQEQKIDEHIAIDRMIERILTYMAKQDKVERAEQFERECAVTSFIPQRVSEPKLNQALAVNLDQDKDALQSILEKLQTDIMQLTEKQTTLNKSIDAVNNSIKTIDSQWIVRQKNEANIFVDSISGKLIGEDGKILQLSPTKIEKFRAAFSTPVPGQLMSINPALQQRIENELAIAVEKEKASAPEMPRDLLKNIVNKRVMPMLDLVRELKTFIELGTPDDFDQQHVNVAQAVKRTQINKDKMPDIKHTGKDVNDFCENFAACKRLDEMKADQIKVSKELGEKSILADQLVASIKRPKLEPQAAKKKPDEIGK